MAILASCAIQIDHVNSTELNSTYQSLILEDPGNVDGVRRILFASNPTALWVNWMILFDAITRLLGTHSSPPVTVHPKVLKDPTSIKTSDKGSTLGTNDTWDLIRWVLIDIDDFPRRFDRFTLGDAISLLHIQNRWRQWIPQFTFNIGFCGEFWSEAMQSRSSGVSWMWKNRHQFQWFDHLWSHERVYNLDEIRLTESMTRSKRFAEVHDIPVSPSYAVSPEHSGVYPVLPYLFTSWRKVWNISVTSTYQYPVGSFFPNLGFLINGVQVLPRQVCGLYSYHQWLRDLEGDRNYIENIVLGGSLFRTLLMNPISIFMTHLINFEGDRLATFAFDGLFQFVRNWTHIQLATASPVQLAKLYSDRFALVGVNELPLSNDPCANKRTKTLWVPNWPCGPLNLPQFVILGPQKTGTTALAHFLRLNPTLLANHYQPGTTYEELQFFSSDAVYARGISWYMQQFANSSTLSSNVAASTEAHVRRFEKSATYFDSLKAPARMAAVIPDARLIVLLLNPVERAHSWYQHMLAHQDPIASLLSFTDLMQHGHNLTESKLTQLLPTSKRTRVRNYPLSGLVQHIRRLYLRCVQPGYYAAHLLHWLEHFSPSQILLVDAEQFKRNPIRTLHTIQMFLKLPAPLNYSSQIVFNERKGFHCLRYGQDLPDWSGRKQSPCLGASKGRSYSTLHNIDQLMRVHFALANKNLRRLLSARDDWRYWLSRGGETEYPGWLT